MAKKIKVNKVITNDEDLSEGLPTPEHISEANDIPEGIYFKKKSTSKNKSKK